MMPSQICVRFFQLGKLCTDNSGLPLRPPATKKTRLRERGKYAIYSGMLSGFALLRLVNPSCTCECARQRYVCGEAKWTNQTNLLRQARKTDRTTR